MIKRIGTILAGLVFLGFTVQAQAPQPAAGTAAPHRVVSPEKQPDGKITFRIAAPKASDVQLQLAAGGVRLHPMTKGSDGVWSVTIGPLEPEAYNYSYSVDGLRVYTVNPDASVVDVPGTEPRFDQLQNVPHGSINIHSYFSTVQDRQRGMYIYVPPQYYSEPTRKFPVLYLWHGGGGNEPDWTRSGRTGEHPRQSDRGEKSRADDHRDAEQQRAHTRSGWQHRQPRPYSKRNSSTKSCPMWKRATGC